MLKGLKVIDLSSVLAGPSVGTFFAELGATVVKIEHPIHKDVTRTWKLPEEDHNCFLNLVSEADILNDYAPSWV